MITLHLPVDLNELPRPCVRVCCIAEGCQKVYTATPKSGNPSAKPRIIEGLWGVYWGYIGIVGCIFGLYRDNGKEN